MKILCFIPARGGSKEIKNKNLYKICGKPLIYYTLNLASKIKNIHIFVSTDNIKIKKYSEKFEIKSNYLRPKNLSGDKSLVVDAVLHALNWLKKEKNIHFDAVLMLQPTSPLRDLSEIIKAINKFKKKKLDSLIGVSLMKEHPYECIKLKNNKWDYLERNNIKKSKGRQDYKKKYFFINGSFYMSKVSFLKKNRNFTVKNKTKIFVQKKTIPIDIDTNQDMKMVLPFLK